MKHNRYLIFALLFACVTGLLIFQFLNNLNRKEIVVVARSDIARYSLIDQSMIETKYIHPNSNHASTFSNIQDVVGKYAKEDMVREEILLSSNITENESYQDFTGMLSPEERAIFVPLNIDHGLGGAIQEGDRVDIIYVSLDGNFGMNLSKTVLQSISVLEVRSEDGSTIGSSYNAPCGIIVSVSPHDAEKIAYCIENGSIYLSKVPYGAEKYSAKGIYNDNIYE